MLLANWRVRNMTGATVPFVLEFDFLMSKSGSGRGAISSECRKTDRKDSKFNLRLIALTHMAK